MRNSYSIPGRHNSRTSRDHHRWAWNTLHIYRDSHFWGLPPSDVPLARALCGQTSAFYQRRLQHPWTRGDGTSGGGVNLRDHTPHGRHCNPRWYHYGEWHCSNMFFLNSTDIGNNLLMASYWKHIDDDRCSVTWKYHHQDRTILVLSLLRGTLLGMFWNHERGVVQSWYNYGALHCMIMTTVNDNR